MAQGGAQSPWFACHALSAHRLRSHERVVPGHDCDQQTSRGRAPDSSAAHPKQQLSGKALGEGVHLINPAGSASELVSFEKQLENWGTPRHIEGSPKVSVPHLGPDAHPVMSSTSACRRSAALTYVAT